MCFIFFLFFRLNAVNAFIPTKTPLTPLFFRLITASVANFDRRQRPYTGKIGPLFRPGLQFCIANFSKVTLLILFSCNNITSQLINWEAKSPFFETFSFSIRFPKTFNVTFVPLFFLFLSLFLLLFVNFIFCSHFQWFLFRRHLGISRSVQLLADRVRSIINACDSEEF